MRQIEVINQETIIDVTAETSNVEILVRDYDSELVERFALEAQEAAIDAEESADIATAQASIATAQATIATTQAGIATTQAGIATTQSGIATTKANEASASAASALASEQAADADRIAAQAAATTATTQAGIATTQAGIATSKAGEASASAAAALASETDAETAASTATTQAGIATTQAGIATTQAGIATTQASNALTSANEAAASAASAAQVGTSTLLTGFSTGANSTILATDTILQGFNKTQGQINARVSGTGASGQVAFWNGTSSQTGDTKLTFNSSTGLLTLDGDLTFTGAQTIQTSTGALTIQPLGGITTGINLTNNVNIYSASNTGVIRNTVTNGSLQIVGGNTTSDGGNISLGGSTGTNQVQVRIGASNHSIFAPSGNLLVGATTDGGPRLQVQGTANFVTGVGIGAASSLNYINTGPILTTTLTSGGSGYVDGTYVDVPVILISTNGVGALFTVVVSGGVVTTATLTWAGSAYRVGDTISISPSSLGGSGSGLVITIASVESSQLTIAGNNGGDITLYRVDTSIVTGDNLGTIKWEGRDSSLKASGYSAEIGAFAVGAAGAANLSFFTSAGSGSALTEGFRLTNTSNLLVGTTTDAGFRLDVNGTARVQGALTTTADAVVNGLNIGIGAGSVASNVRIGSGALISNTTGSENSAFGVNSLSLNTTAANNTGVGTGALQNNATGAGNTAIGRSAGRFIADGATILTTATNSVFIGFNSRANANSETNQIAIGHTAIGLGSNTTVLGNTSTTHGRWYGSLLLGTTTNAASSILTMESTTQGFLPPRMTTTQKNAIASPATGLVVYDTTLNKLSVRGALTWETVTSL